MRNIISSALAALILGTGWAAAPIARAQDAAEVLSEAPVIQPRPRQQNEAVGSVTGYPLPRFVSLKGQANVRRGPGLDHKIDWVFTRRGAPLEVIGEYGNWRRVRDHEGFGGWIHYALISGVRNGEITTHRAPIRTKPDDYAEVTALAEKGVVVDLKRCQEAFCEISVGEIEGWVARSDVWGVKPGETEFD
ncbi:SH3 domain-containing protein [Paracoccaceae bacterium GXU_MW_L88]